jgi:hypothetical protein
MNRLLAGLLAFAATATAATVKLLIGIPGALVPTPIDTGSPLDPTPMTWAFVLGLAAVLFTICGVTLQRSCAEARIED